MKKKFKITLVVFLVVILGCFPQVFAATNQNAKLKKSIKSIRSARLLDNTTKSENTTWNQQDKDTDVNLSNNNLTAQVMGGQSSGAVRATNYKTSGKWYWEITLGDYNTSGYFNGSIGMGIANPDFNINTSRWNSTDQISFYADENIKNMSDVSIGIYPKNSNYPNNYGALYTKGDTIGIALDLDNKSIKFSVNRKWYDNFSIPSWNKYFPIIWSGSSMSSEKQSVTTNFGATKFQNTVPDGYLPFDYINISNIDLSKHTDSLTVGQTDTLTATVTPDSATNKNVKWTSSNPNIATVDSNGKVTGIKAGNVVITATTTDGKTASCKVTVKDQTTISLNKISDTINVGKIDTLISTVNPSNVGVVWTSNDQSVAIVDKKGHVKALKVGTATITATATDGSNAHASCVINVTKLAGGITLNKSVDDLIVGEADSIVVLVLPRDATIKDVNWTSSDSSIVSVDTNGNITALKEGTAVITATVNNDSNLHAQCTIHVN